jgi:hypothetical protein
MTADIQNISMLLTGKWIVKQGKSQLEFHSTIDVYDEAKLIIIGEDSRTQTTTFAVSLLGYDEKNKMIYRLEIGNADTISFRIDELTHDILRITELKNLKPTNIAYEYQKLRPDIFCADKLLQGLI